MTPLPITLPLGKDNVQRRGRRKTVILNSTGQGLLDCAARTSNGKSTSRRDRRVLPRARAGWRLLSPGQNGESDWFGNPGSIQA